MKNNTPKERLLDGKIIWLERTACNQPYSLKQEIWTSHIHNARLTNTGLSFLCRSEVYNYTVKLNKIKDTNLQGSVYCSWDDDYDEYKLDLQIFENRLGMFLEGEWNENESIDLYCFIHLYYV